MCIRDREKDVGIQRQPGCWLRSSHPFKECVIAHWSRAVSYTHLILVLQAWKEVAERHGIAGVEAACHECLGTNSVVSKGRCV